MKKSKEYLMGLCFRLVNTNKEYQELVELLKDYHNEMPVFPAPIDLQNQHGGALGYAAFRAGQLHPFHLVETMAREHEQKLEYEAKQNETENDTQ